MYQAQAPGGVVNQIVVPEPIRALPRPVDLRPRRKRDEIPRTTIIGEISGEISSGPVQIVARDGWGKTSVVSQLVYQTPIESYRDGVAVISAWGLPAEDVEQAIFDAFFESTLPDTTFKTTPGQLRTSFSDIQAALIVDDLDIPRQQVDRIINACAGCGFVSTASSQTMWSGGAVLDLERMDVAQALALFEQRLGRTIETGEKETVARFISRASGYPMAIVAAAAAVRRGAAIIEGLDHIATAADPIAAVHETIRDTLTLGETRVLSVLGAVQGAPLPSDAVRVAAGVDDAHADLERLKFDGLVKSASPTYRLSATAASLLDLQSSPTETAEGLSRWCSGETRPGSVASAGAAIINTVQEAARLRDLDAAINLGRSADPALSLSGHWGLWSKLLEEVAAVSAEASNLFVESWTLHQLGTRSLVTGNTDDAERKLNQAADMRRHIGDAAGLEVTEHNLGFLTPIAVAAVRGPKHEPSVTWEPEDNVVPNGSGIPGWVWAIAVIGIIAAVGALIFLLVRDDPNPPAVVVTVGESGEIVSNTEVIEFPELPVGSSVSAEIELINTGPGIVEISGVGLEGDESFGLSSGCGALEVTETCLVEVTFTPEQPGDAAGEIIVEHSGNTGRLGIPVFGIAIEPPEAFLIVDPVIIDFGAVTQTSDEAVVTSETPNEWTRQLEVVNAGDLDVTVHGIRLETPRFVQTSNCTVLEPGASCTIEVRLLAGEPGVYEDTLTVEHSAQNEPFQVPLSGFVPTPPNLTIEIVDFGVAEDTFEVDFATHIASFWSVPIAIEITNSGQEPVVDPFAVRFEVLNTSDDVIPWLPAPTPDSPTGEILLDATVGPNETIRIETAIGLNARTSNLGGTELIRAVVDSCFERGSPPTPPCRIVESNEQDNVSPEFKIQVVTDQIDPTDTTEIEQIE